MKKTVVSLLGLIGFAAFAAQANAAPAQHVANPDLNGDGQADTVIIKRATGSPNEQVMLSTVRGRLMHTRLPFESATDAQPVRVVDVNGDGKDEVVVTEIMGASTEHFSIWEFDGTKMRSITKTDGSQMRLFEGGGMSAISDYGCAGGRLVTVGAVLDWDTGLYTGDRITYSVQNGVATEVSRTTATGPRDSVVFQVDPGACA